MAPRGASTSLGGQTKIRGIYTALRLFLASEAYHRNMVKKKDNDALDDAEKLMPVDTLGIVMIIHGEEFGEDSPFGGYPPHRLHDRRIS